MALEITVDVLKQIHALGEKAYPEEGVGLLLGEAPGEIKRVISILAFTNSREDDARHNRYLITPQDMLHGEQQAMRLGLEVVGVFHSHPDRPNRPSEFDREWALPWFSYVITSVQAGRAVESRSWRLLEDRSSFEAEYLVINEK